MSIRFDDCVLETDTRQLLRGGMPVPLTPKAYELLELLVTQRPKAVSKVEIYDRLWPRTFVSEVNLARLMFEIRTALGDQARRPRYLRTVRGFGYAFCATGTDVTRSKAVPRTSGPSFWLIWKDKEQALQEGENVLGRTREADVMIESTSVSRRHARIVVAHGTAILEDLGSKNGTRVAGRKAERPVSLSDGDLIRVGSVDVTFRMLPPEAPTATAREGNP
jgi:DNA-binding winged helix-turn-helix (wHTH) protein